MVAQEEKREEKRKRREKIREEKRSEAKRREEKRREEKSGPHVGPSWVICKSAIRYSKVLRRCCKSAIRYATSEIRLPPLWAHMDVEVLKCYKVCKEKDDFATTMGSYGF